MSELVNPYASPESDITATPFAEGGPLDTPGLKTTGVGLSLVYYGIIVLVLAFLTIFFGSIFLAFGGQAANAPPNISPGYRALIMIGGGAVILGGLLMLAGQIVCLFVPAQSGAKGYIIAAVALQLTNFLQYLLPVLQPLFPGMRSFIVVSVLINLGGFTSFICFVLFMRKVSEYIDRRDFMGRARNLLILVFVLIGVSAMMFVGMVMQQHVIASIAVIVLCISALVAFLMYANLINSLRKVLLGKVPSQRASQVKKSILLGPGMGMKDR